MIKYGRIEIGEEAFVGTRSIIMPGGHIGKHSVVGAGSIVTKDVPDYTVVAGVPARIVCTTKEYAEKALKVCLSILIKMHMTLIKSYIY